MPENPYESPHSGPLKRPKPPKASKLPPPPDNPWRVLWGLFPFSFFVVGHILGQIYLGPIVRPLRGDNTSYGGLVGSLIGLAIGVAVFKAFIEKPRE